MQLEYANFVWRVSPELMIVPPQRASPHGRSIQRLSKSRLGNRPVPLVALTANECSGVGESDARVTFSVASSFNNKDVDRGVQVVEAA